MRDRVSAGQRIQDGHCQKVEQRSTYEFQGVTGCHGARCWRARWRKRKGASKKPDEAEEHGRDDAGRREDEPHDIAHRDRLSLLGRSRVRVCPRSTRVPGCLGAFGRSRALRCSEVLWCGALLGCSGMRGGVCARTRGGAALAGVAMLTAGPPVPSPLLAKSLRMPRRPLGLLGRVPQATSSKPLERDIRVGPTQLIEGR